MTAAAIITESLHWGLALVPVLLLLGVFVWLDVFELMSLPEIMTLLVLGGFAAILSYPVSGRLIDVLPIGFSFYSRFVAPWIEEAIKGAIIVALFWRNRIGYKLDAVISGFAIGAGFSVIENILYLTSFPQYGTGTWLVRGLGTAVMHGTTVAVLAAIAHELAEREMRESAADFDFSLLWFLPGYLIAVALHTAFNQFPDRPLISMMGAAVLAPFTIMTIFHFGTLEAERWLAVEREVHREQLEALRAGRWPNGASGDKISPLAARLDSETVGLIRRYWELLTWLVLQSEETLMEEIFHDGSPDRARIDAAFAEVDELQRRLGKSTLGAVKPLLPFSRNDYWEISELRERLSR